MVSHQQVGLGLEVEVSSSTSTWENNNNNNNSNSSPLSLISHKTNKLSAEDSDMDDDLFTVPDVETRQQQPPPMMNTTSTCPDNHQNTNTNNNLPDHHGFQNQKRRRGRNPVDKEHRRLKRLLRNRVSAQQARERKKVYVNDLELRAKELQDTNSKLEEKISSLLNENAVLRKVLLNTRPKVDQSIEQTHD